MNTTNNNTTSARDKLHDTAKQYLIGGKGNTNDDDKYVFFENVVPGDIIYYSGHIMMVLNVGTSDGVSNNHMYWNDGIKVSIMESVYHSTDKCFWSFNT